MSTPLFGEAANLRLQATSLNEISQLAKMLAYWARGFPDADLTAADAFLELQRRLVLLRLTLDGGADRLERKQNAHERAMANAERRVVAALRRIEADGLEQDGGFNPHGFFVYTLWAEDSRVLYVGQSTNVLARLGSHLGTRGKRDAVHRVTLLRCATHAQMCRTEMQLIYEHRPVWNVVGNTAADCL